MECWVWCGDGGLDGLTIRVFRSLGVIRNNIVRFWIDRKLHGLDFKQPEQPSLREAMATIHQPAICRQNDRISKIGIPNALCVLCHCPAGWNVARPKPAISIQFRNRYDGHRSHRQIASKAPQALGIPHGATCRYWPRMFFWHGFSSRSRCCQFRNTPTK